jgi:ribosomal protein S18 acetylase RimI-like enzyme
MLDNPVYNALNTGDAHLARGNNEVKYFDLDVSPFVGFLQDHEQGFKQLREWFEEGRMILYATRQLIREPPGFKLLHEITGLQFVYRGSKEEFPIVHHLEPLQKEHAGEMVQLAKLTRPGPFDMRTMEFGHYYGIFENGKLVAMTGQRLHPLPYSEVSAVCTHPDYLGKGYAASLVKQQLNLIQQENKIPFLHVRDDNDRAIALYERLGFEKNGVMNFYFMRRMDKA